MSFKLFTFDPELPWRIDYCFNDFIDFCIWILEIDGLCVTPFDQHPEGNRILQNRGLDAYTWRQWLATVVALQDPILRHYELLSDPSSWVEETLNTVNSMYLDLKQHPEWLKQHPDWLDAQIDLAVLRSRLESQSSASKQQYQTAVAQVSHLAGNPIDYRERPFDVFPGSPEMKEILVSLWERYKQICEQERAETPYRRETSRAIGNGGKNELWGLEYLNIYKVRYPVPVEYFVPSVSVIVSLANNLVAKSDEFYALVERAAINFAQAND